MENRKYPKRVWRHLLSTPFLWMMFLPIFLADVMGEVYHRICFPLWKLPLVERKKYIRVMDRLSLPYLTPWEKFNCAYCAYVNGWLHYASKIASESEKYWCAIRHKKEGGYISAPQEENYVEYGDREEFERRFRVRKEGRK